MAWLRHFGDKLRAFELCPAGFAFLLLMVSDTSSSQTTIYSETFGTNGLTNNCGSWYTQFSTVASLDYFEVVSGKMQTNDTDNDPSGEAVWYSKEIDISGHTGLNISADFGRNLSMGASQYVKAYYKVDGGAEQLWFDGTDDTWAAGNKSYAIPETGATLQIVIRSAAAGSDNYTFDNVKLENGIPTTLYLEDFPTNTLTSDCPEWWTKWSNSVTPRHFKTNSNRMEGANLDYEAVWYSASIDISSCLQVEVSVDFGYSGSMSSLEYIKAYYKIDGGAETEWLDLTEDSNPPWTSNPLTGTLNAPTGSTLELVIKAYHTGSADVHWFDNVTVQCCNGSETTTANAGSDQPGICGTTATLAGNTPGTGTGQWTLTSGSGTITNDANPTSGVTALGSGANVFRWTISSGICSNYDEVTLTAANAVGGTASSASSVCDGDDVSLSLSGHSGTIQWQEQVNGGGYSNIAGATTTPYSRGPLSTGNTYDYRALLTDGSCTDYSTVTSVTTITASCDFSFTGTSISLCNDIDCGRSSYTLTQATGSNGSETIETGATFTVTFPAGTDVRTVNGGTYNGTAIASYTVVSQTQINFTTPSTINPGTSFDIVLEGITNGTVSSGVATTSVTNTGGGTSSYSPYTFSTTACPATASYTFASPGISLSTNFGCPDVDYTFTQSLTADKGSQIDSGQTVTVDFISGTDATTATSGTFNGTAINASTWTKTATQITFVSPIEVACPSASFTIVLNDITSPSGGGSGNASVSVANVTGGTDSYTSYAYTITAGCGGSCATPDGPYMLYEGESNYAAADAAGKCYHNLEAGKTYCYAFVQPTTGTITHKIAFDFPGCGSCSLGASTADITSCAGAGSCSTFDPNAVGDWVTYDPDCNYLREQVNVGGSCNILGGTYTVCFGPLNACANGGSICPMVSCVNDPDCQNGTGGGLPILLLYFKAIPFNGIVGLEWITVVEINNDYFTVERSADGRYFEEVAIVGGAGNSNNILTYYASDRQPPPGTSYYRLKQTDYDGTYAYSELVAVDFDDEAAPLVVHPNPAAENQVFIELYGAKEEAVNIRVYNVIGEPVISVKALKNDDRHSAQVPTGGLAPGAYFVTAYTSDGTFAAKLFIE